MESYRTEEEQLQVLKKWWAENGVSMLLTIAVAVAVIFGWRGWQAQQVAHSEAGAYAYRELLQALAAVETEPDDINIATALHQAEKIKEDQADSGYGFFAALFKARQAVADGDFALAESELQWVLAQQPPAELRAVVDLRLARVLFAQDKAEQALVILNKFDAQQMPAFLPLSAELTGDILASQQQYQQAYDSYLEAQTFAEQAGVQQSALLAAKLGYAKSFL